MVGIAGTAVLVAMFFVTRVSGNPITGRGGPLNAVAAFTEIAQFAFIGLASAILFLEGKRGHAVA